MTTDNVVDWSVPDMEFLKLDVPELGHTPAVLLHWLHPA